jgi:selenocysteine lyase/cysteine desulfurase
MDRRHFLSTTFAAAAVTALHSLPSAAQLTRTTPGISWEQVRALFPLDPSVIQMAGFFLASHPKPVADEIERHRSNLDRNPFMYIEENIAFLEKGVRQACADFFGGTIDNYAMTDSTTMGLGTIYNGLKLKPGQEILTTEHDHWSTMRSLDFTAQRTGAKVNRITLYDDPAFADADDIANRVKQGLTPKTRVVAVTWVHSSWGVKLPIGKIADVIAEFNRNRNEGDHALLCVDGVHGFGIENVTIDDLRADFFMAGCHKWLFGPRGTGLIYGTPKAWKAVIPTIPDFDVMWRDWDFRNPDFSKYPKASMMTPGGFHSFEHRWALPAAFQLHEQIGRPRIAMRIHQLNSQCKEGLAGISKVRLWTPKSPDLSAGIICFDIQNMKPGEVVKRLQKKGVMASESPYAISCPRVAPSLLTMPEDVDKTIEAIQAVAAS